MALTNGTGSVADFMGSYLTNGTQMLALNIYNTGERCLCIGQDRIHHPPLGCDLYQHVIEYELPDITQYDTADQVRQEIRRTEEIDPSHLRCTGVCTGSGF
mgnify:CR=1 FL=1